MKSRSPDTWRRGSLRSDTLQHTPLAPRLSAPERQPRGTLSLEEPGEKQRAPGAELRWAALPTGQASRRVGQQAGGPMEGALTDFYYDSY